MVINNMVTMATNDMITMITSDMVTMVTAGIVDVTLGHERSCLWVSLILFSPCTEAVHQHPIGCCDPRHMTETHLVPCPGTTCLKQNQNEEFVLLTLPPHC